jgi:hypothetical protein
MFIMLTKSIMYLCHVFPPILSVLVHAILFSIYAVSISYQVGSDTSDPAHPQHGAPWYITKSCSAAHDPSINGYCLQAKAAFACTVAMTAVFVTYFGFAVWSCIPSASQKAEYADRKRASEERYASKEAYDMVPATPYTPGLPRLGQGQPLNPTTPRTLAFNRLGGTGPRELPLRKHFSSPNAAGKTESGSFVHVNALRSPDITRSPMMSPGFAQVSGRADEEMSQGGQGQAEAEMYFPPPPKQVIGKK